MSSQGFDSTNHPPKLHGSVSLETYCYRSMPTPWLVSAQVKRVAPWGFDSHTLAPFFNAGQLPASHRTNSIVM